MMFGGAYEPPTKHKKIQEDNTMSYVEQVDPEMAAIFEKELKRQESRLNLIASENYTSRAVMEAMGSVMTNKYAEGYSGNRYYGGCEFMDEAEDLAIARAKELFGAEHVNDVKGEVELVRAGNVDFDGSTVFVLFGFNVFLVEVF